MFTILQKSPAKRFQITSGSPSKGLLAPESKQSVRLVSHNRVFGSSLARLSSTTSPPFLIQVTDVDKPPKTYITIFLAVPAFICIKVVPPNYNLFLVFLRMCFGRNELRNIFWNVICCFNFFELFIKFKCTIHFVNVLIIINHL